MRRRVPNRGNLSALAAPAILGIASSAAAVCGDANGDGRVSVSDGVQALRAAAGLESICAEDCDVDGNGEISVTDGVNILRKAAGLAIVEACPDDDRVASVIGHTVDIFGPLTKIGAFGGAIPQGSLSPCENSGGSFDESDSGFVFGDCEIDGVSFTGFIAKGDGSLGFSGISVARQGDVLTLQGTLSVGEIEGNPQLSGVLQGDSQILGPYSILFQQVVSGELGQTLGGTLVFDTSEADLDDVVEITVTLNGDTILPVVVRYADDTTQNFTYDTDADELTPADQTPPVARVRLATNVGDRITAFLNLQQVLQVQPISPGTTDTGFLEVGGLECGDNLFEFVVENLQPGSGYAFRAELEVDGSVVSSRACGQVGVQGCDDNTTTQGVVVRDVSFVCVPCAPCTRGAGTCADPLNIQNRDRIQIHGRTSGSGDFSGGACGTAVGPESVFRFTPPTTGCYEFSTCGTSFDSQLYIGDGLCPGTSGPFPENCIDDNEVCTDGSNRELTFAPLSAGQPITLILEGEGGPGGDYTFDVRPSGRCLD